MEQEKTVNVDGTNYKVGQFSAAIQQAVEIYNAFQADLQKSQLEVIKNQAALQSIGNQISEGIKHELSMAELTATPNAEEIPKPSAKKKAKAK